MFLKKIDRFRSGLFYKVFARFAGLFILLQFLVYIAIFLVVQEHLILKDRKMLKNHFAEISDIITTNSENKISKTLEQHLNKKQYKKLFIRVVNPSREVIYTHRPEDFERFSLSDIENTLHGVHFSNSLNYFTISRNEFSEETLEIISAPLTNSNILQIGIDTDDTEDLLELLAQVLLGATFISTALSLLLGYINAKRTLRPLGELASIMKENLTGQLKPMSSKVSNTFEIDELILIFNKMIFQIQSLISSLHHTLDAIAHDLRTPLMHLKNSLTELQNEIVEPKEKEMINGMYEEIDQLNVIISTLLEISEVTANNFNATASEFSLKDLLLECADIFEYAVEEKMAQIIISGDDFTVSSHRSLLRRVVCNLIDNSLKYSEQSVSINLEAEAIKETFSIVVRDNGWGIPEDQIERVFERLYRVDVSRSRPGMGLGLSFVKAVIEAMQGQIEIKSVANAVEQRGIEVKLIIPNLSKM